MRNFTRAPRQDDFGRDDDWQRAMRDTYLIALYDHWIEEKASGDGAYVFFDTGQCAMAIQKEIGVDTFLDWRANDMHRQFGIEEKIVRWPARNTPYTAYTFETWSCTVEGREKEGWLMYSAADLLVYAFEQDPKLSDAVLVHVIPMQPLRGWLLSPRDPALPDAGYLVSRYASTVTDQINRTECHVVPVGDVFRNVPNCQVWRVELRYGGHSPYTYDPSIAGATHVVERVAPR